MWRRGERPYGTLGSARQHPELGDVNEARVIDGGAVGRGRGHRASSSCATRPSCAATSRCPTRRRRCCTTVGCAPATWCATTATSTYTFVGRVKEVIRRRGENLSPAEVEAALERHPDVAEAAVIAVASELSEDDVKAFVVGRAGRDRRPGRAARASRPGSWPRSRCRATSRSSTSCRTVRPGGSRSTGCRWSAPRTRWTSPPRRVRLGRWRLRAAPHRGCTPGSAPSDAEHIRVAGRDLPSEVMGQLTLTELSYLLVTRREPTDGQRRLVDAVLVSLADHGLTPSALATRLTYTGAPESIQGAVAAGLLGAGSVFLGPTGDTAEFLAAALADAGGDDRDRPRHAAADRRSRGRRPPRRRPAGARARPSGAQGRRSAHAADLRAGRGRGPARSAPSPAGGRWPRSRPSRAVERLPVNGAGAGGAALLDAGVPARAVRGMALIARTAGLVAHLVEEADSPIGMPLWLEVEARAGDDA